MEAEVTLRVSEEVPSEVIEAAVIQPVESAPVESAPVKAVPEKKLKPGRLNNSISTLQKKNGIKISMPCSLIDEHS